MTNTYLTIMLYPIFLFLLVILSHSIYPSYTHTHHTQSLPLIAFIPAEAAPVPEPTIKPMKPSVGGGCRGGEFGNEAVEVMPCLSDSLSGFVKASSGGCAEEELQITQGGVCEHLPFMYECVKRLGRSNEPDDVTLALASLLLPQGEAETVDFSMCNEFTGVTPSFNGPTKLPPITHDLVQKLIVVLMACRHGSSVDSLEQMFTNPWDQVQCKPRMGTRFPENDNLSNWTGCKMEWQLDEPKNGKLGHPSIEVVGHDGQRRTVFRVTTTSEQVIELVGLTVSGPPDKNENSGGDGGDCTVEVMPLDVTDCYDDVSQTMSGLAGSAGQADSAAAGPPAKDENSGGGGSGNKPVAVMSAAATLPDSLSDILKASSRGHPLKKALRAEEELQTTRFSYKQQHGAAADLPDIYRLVTGSVGESDEPDEVTLELASVLLPQGEAEKVDFSMYNELTGVTPSVNGPTKLPPITHDLVRKLIGVLMDWRQGHSVGSLKLIMRDRFPENDNLSNWTGCKMEWQLEETKNGILAHPSIKVVGHDGQRRTVFRVATMSEQVIEGE
eukprot:GHVQ01030135.1.p1 GENE.GHVQ01030135.1~~GHVQ01030135.1.p1  ORF type:complete len:555 (-),score=71.21 GHVQ01030135.1:192-1856(-)